MSNYLSKFRFQWGNKALFSFISVVFLFSLFYSKFLLSVSMILWFLLSFINIKTTKGKLAIGIHDNLSDRFRAFFQHPSFWVISGVFICMLFSLINTSDLSYGLHHLKLNLPFLILPFVFFSAKFIDKKWVHLMHYTFVFISAICVLQILVVYFLDFENITKSLSYGKSLPTPIHHVSLSLILAYATISSLILWRRDNYYPQLSKLALVCFVGLFVFLHVLAVRSGIVTCYLALIAYLIYEIVQFKKYSFGIVMLCLCIATPFIAYYSIPSFYNKISYARYDITKSLSGNEVDYSDGGRLISYKLGIDLFKEQKILGTGIGDIKQESEKWYKTHIPEYKGKLNFPHNQALFLMAATGIIGTMIYFFSLLFPFITKKRFKDPFCLSLFVIVFSSFIVESSLSHSYTIAFFLFFFLISMAGNREDDWKKERR